MMELKPGEYIGKDGRTYRWWRDTLGYLHTEAHTGPTEEVQIRPADWPAAKAALDALVEAEEWVEHDGYRIRRDGSQPQQLLRGGGDYGDMVGLYQPTFVWFYRAGLAEGHKQEAEKSRELREAVAEAEALRAREGRTSIFRGDWEHVVALAEVGK